MDSTAIKEISKMAATTAGRISSIDMPAMTMPDGWKINSLESFMRTPSRHRSVFDTTELDDFISYVDDTEEEHTNNATIYIDKQRMRAICIFDHGTPQTPDWGQHRAILDMQKTPEYAALTTNNGHKFTQQEFIDFISDWQPHIEFLDTDGNPMKTTDVISAVRKITVAANREQKNEVADYKTSRSAMESIEIKSATALPAAMRFSCAPYPGISEFEATSRLYARTGESPAIAYRINALQALQTHIADEMAGLIGERVQTPIYHGTINHQLGA